MSKTAVIASLFAGLVSVSPSFADPITCAGGQTLQFYHDTYGSTGCTIGNFIAKNFDYALVSLITPNPVTASNIIVTPQDNAAGPDFDFSANWSVTGLGTIESGVLFHMESAHGFGLTDVTLSATGSRSGLLGTARVSEVDCLGGVLDLSGFALGGLGSVACTGGGVAASGNALLPVGAGVSANALISFNSTAFQVDILKDVAVTGLAAGSASVTNIGQQFTQVSPEPATFGFAALGLLAGICARSWTKSRKI